MLGLVERGIPILYTAPTNSAIKNGATSFLRLRQLNLGHWIPDLVLVGTEDFLMLGNDQDLNNLFLDYRVFRMRELQVAMIQSFNGFTSPYETEITFSEFKIELQRRAFELIQSLESGREIWQVLLPSSLIHKAASDFERNLITLKSSLSSFREVFATLEKPFDNNHKHFQALVTGNDEDKNPQLEVYDGIFNDGLKSCLKATNRFSSLIQYLQKLFSRSESHLKTLIMQAAKVVFSTVSVAGREMFQKFPNEAVVVIDEAA